MFNDPLGTISISLPPGWAFDPMSSSLTRLAFIDWTEPTTRRMFVLLIPSLSVIAPSGTESDWETAVRDRLPAGATRIERRRDPTAAVYVEIPGAAGRPDSRFAWMRGSRLDVLLEQQSVPCGGALATSELAEALRTLNVPVNNRIVERRPKAEWNAAMDSADSARAAGDTAAAGHCLLLAREIASNTWLNSLIRGPNPDIFVAAHGAEATLALAEITGSVECLYQATTTLYRCRFSRESNRLARTATDDYIDRLIYRALELHGRFAQGPAPGNCLAACQVRSYLFQRELASLLESRRQKASNVSWMALSNLATMAIEDAMSVVAVASIGPRSTRYCDLPDETKAVLLAAGVTDDVSWKKKSQEEQIQALDYLVSAGRALSTVTLGAASVSASAMKANALKAARRLAELAPSPTRIGLLIDNMNGYAGSLVELGDQQSLDEAKNLIIEAQSILDRVGNNRGLRAVLAANEASLCHEQKQIEAGLAAADRAILLARSAGLEGTEGRAHASRSRLLNLAGLHEEALAEACCALSLLHDETMTVAHETMALAYHYVGESSLALDEVRAGLAVALADNPLSDAVDRFLCTAALVLRQCNPAASLAAIEAAEVLFDVRRTDIGGIVERIAYHDNISHRELAATLVKQKLDAGDILGALATADRHRARSLIEIGGIPGPARMSFTIPPADASLADQIAFVAATAQAMLKKWGMPPPLDGSALSRIIASHGRTVVLFHPSGTQLLIFIAKPGIPLTVDVRVGTVSFPEVLRLTDELRQQLGIAIAGRGSRGGHLPIQSIDELKAGFIADNKVLEQADAQLNRLRCRLHDALFSEVLPLLKDREPIVVVPYRELSVIPFAVLANAEGQTLIERHSLSELPSLASLSVLAQPGSGPIRGVVVGDPLLAVNAGLPQLREAAAEARHIKDLLKGAGIDATLFIGPDATEEKFCAKVSGARLVHLACHAALREPVSASPLFLTPSQYDDGLLLPAEIADLHLDGALVVLSACQSGLGRATADGVLGLGRAFMQAGARTMVLSLWRVGDKTTADFMGELYSGLLGSASELKGQRLDVASAVQRAQLITCNKLSRHPSVWGPWLVVGDGGWQLG